MTRTVWERLLLGALCVAAGELALAQARLLERVWYDGSRPIKVWMAPDEVAVTFEPGRVPASRAEAERIVRRTEPSAVLEKQVGVVHYFKVSDGHTPAEHAAAVRSDPAVRFASPVFHPGDRHPETRMALTGEIIVGFQAAVSDREMDAFTRRHQLRLLKALDFSPHTYVFDARAVDDSLALANELYLSGQVAFASPNWIKTATPR